MDERRDKIAETWTPDDERQLSSLLAEELAEDPGPPPSLSEIELAKIRRAARTAWQAQQAAAPRAAPRRRWPVFAALAALLALAVSAILWLGVFQATPAATLELASGQVSIDGRDLLANTLLALDLGPGSRVETGAGSHATLRLAGGAELRLDQATELRLQGKRAAELIRGAVYVVVDRPASQRAALALATPLGVVRDIGTRFEARLEGDALQLRVRDGRVELEPLLGEIQKVETGEQLTLNPAGRADRLDLPTWDPSWAWTWQAADLPDIEGQTLDTFLAWVGQETGWQVRYNDPQDQRAAATAVLHGSIAGLDRDQALHLVLRGSGFEYRVVAGVLWVGEGG